MAIPLLAEKGFLRTISAIMRNRASVLSHCPVRV